MYQDFEGIYGNLIEYIQQLGAEKETFKTKLIYILVLVIVLLIALGIIIYVYKDDFASKLSEIQTIVTVIAIVFIALFSLCLVKIGKSTNRYNKIFKDKILPNLLSNIDKNLVYSPKQGLSKEVYNQSGLAIEYNKFKSEDYISGYIAENALLEMSEVNAQKIEKDKEGKEVVVESFEGLVAVATLKKNTKNDIKIVKNSFWKMNREANIRIASAQFEQYFDMYADNKIVAMQIFTTEVIEEILTFVDEMKIHLEISIKQNKLYATFKTGEMYEGGITKNPKELLSKYYVITYFIIRLIKRINKAIEEAEF